MVFTPAIFIWNLLASGNRPANLPSGLCRFAVSESDSAAATARLIQRKSLGGSAWQQPKQQIRIRIRKIARSPVGLARYELP
jgi:hypothetical protein